MQDLDRMGWSTLVVWECETEAADALSQRPTCFLEETSCGLVTDR